MDFDRLEEITERFAPIGWFALGAAVASIVWVIVS